MLVKNKWHKLLNTLHIFNEDIMTDQDKFDFLKSAFNDLFKKQLPEFTRDTPIQDMGLDSLDIVELQMEFEKRYNVEIPDPENDLKTVGDLLDHLKA